MIQKLSDAFDFTVDQYLEHPVFVDFAFTGLLCLVANSGSVIPMVLSNLPNQLTIIPYVITTDVTLAGFILAALTIIVTFKSNLKVKGIEESNNALELILSSKHYRKIVTVFKNAISELVLCFIILFFIWAAADNFSIKFINRINCASILITALTISRSLFILFLILNMEEHEQS